MFQKHMLWIWLTWLLKEISRIQTLCISQGESEERAFLDVVIYTDRKWDLSQSWKAVQLNISEFVHGENIGSLIHCQNRDNWSFVSHTVDDASIYKSGLLFIF